ncbi:MAG: extracellular solute-binding protein [Armatimonadetes bacterium]|nr:extracellular solute-binding protein [Armatimonadota bacterium]
MALAAVALLLLTACQPKPAPPAAPAPAAGPARAKVKVTVYSPHGREMLEPFEKRFEAAHPDVDVEWLDMGSQEVLDRLRAERANPACDIWWGAPHTMFAKAARDGLLAPYKPTWAGHLAAGRRDATDLWYGQYLTPSVIVYNSQALKPEQAPQDWDDLLKPAWKDKILIRDPLGSGTMRTWIAAMLQRAKTLDDGWQWLLQLDANTKSYPANPSLLHLGLTKRQGLVSVWALRDVEIQKRVNKYPLAYVIPRSGCPVVTDAIALVKSGPHPEPAKLFYEFVTSAEQLQWAGEQFDCMPARDDIDPAGLPARMPIKVPEIKLDWDRIDKEGDAWMTHWDQQIKGRGKAR